MLLRISEVTVANEQTIWSILSDCVGFNGWEWEDELTIIVKDVTGINIEPQFKEEHSKEIAKLMSQLVDCYISFSVTAA